MSIGKFASGPGAASYYLDRVGCPLDYYLGRGERGGVWIGRGADAGLHGLLNTRRPSNTRSRVPAANVARLLTRACAASRPSPPLG